MKVKHLSLDRFSSLPPAILDNILCLVPIQEAARTCILSKNCRDSWLTIPKLEFIEDDFEVTTDENQLSIMEEMFVHSPSERTMLSKRCKFFSAIHQILLVHRGPINEFTISMTADDTCVEIDQIIRHLSMNYIYSVKKFKLDLRSYSYRVPLSIFSLHKLTDLYLHNCVFYHCPTKFSGFSTLTRLYFDNVNTDTETLVCLISNSPLLTSLTLMLFHDNILDSGATVFDLFECLPLIEHLSISEWVIQWIATGAFRRELPTSLVHIKYIFLDAFCFLEEYELRFLALLMRCSPNLEKIKIQASYCPDYEYPEIDSATPQYYSGIWLEHLKEVEIEYFEYMKPKMEFVKVILAKAPVLKKISIRLCDHSTHEELKMLGILLGFPRASPLVDIIVQRACGGIVVEA